MASVNDFLEIIQQPSLGLVMATMPYLGTYRKAFDSYNRTRTISGSPQWRHNKGFGFFPNTNGVLVVAHGAEQNPSSITIFVGFSAKYNHTAASQVILGKGGYTGDYYKLDTTLGTLFRFQASLSTAVFTPGSLTGKRVLSVRLLSGGLPSLFIDGSFHSTSGTALTLTAGPDPIHIGATAAGASPNLTPLQAALIFNTQLSDQLISEITERFLHLPPVDRMSPVKGAKFVSLPADPVVNAKCTEVFDGKIQANGTMIGKKGISTGTQTIPIGQYSGGQVLPGAIVSRNNGANLVTLSNAASLATATQGAFEFVITPKFSSPVLGYIGICNANNTTYFRQGSAGTLTFVKGVPNVTVSTVAAITHADQIIHYLATWWTDSGIQYMELFVDGVSQGTAQFLDSTAMTTAFLCSGGGSLPFDGKEHLVRTYNQRVTPTEARQLYLEHAVTATRQASRNCYPESLAAVGAGKAGPWDVGSGTWRWEEDGEKRKLVSVTAGHCSWPSQQAYGAWYWKTKNYSLYMVPISSANVTVAGSWNGYFILVGGNGQMFFYRRSGAASALLVQTAAGFIGAAAEYEFFVARRYDGLFNIFVRGGVYSVWTLALTTTDATHTTSAFMNLTSTAASQEFSQLALFPLGGTLTPNEVPAFRDAT